MRGDAFMVSFNTQKFKGCLNDENIQGIITNHFPLLYMLTSSFASRKRKEMDEPDTISRELGCYAPLLSFFLFLTHL